MDIAAAAAAAAGGASVAVEGMLAGCWSNAVITLLSTCRSHSLLHRAAAGPLYEDQPDHQDLPRHWPGCLWPGGTAAGVCAAVPGAVLLLCGLPYPGG
jgi:hypothetical protein